MTTDPAPPLILLGRGIFVGSALLCDAAGAKFARRLHILDPDNTRIGRCRLADEPGPADLCVRLRDIAPLTTASVAVPALSRFLAGDDRLLIHCPTGLARAPLLAVLALAVRGETVDEAVARVLLACWAGARLAPLLFPEPLADVDREVARLAPSPPA